MLRQSYDNYIQKEHNKLYQAVTLGSSIFFQHTLVRGSLIFNVALKNVVNFLFRLRFFNNFVLVYIGYSVTIASFLCLCFSQNSQSIKIFSSTNGALN